MRALIGSGAQHLPTVLKRLNATEAAKRSEAKEWWRPRAEAAGPSSVLSLLLAAAFLSLLPSGRLVSLLPPDALGQTTPTGAVPEAPAAFGTPPTAVSARASEEERVWPSRDWLRGPRFSNSLGRDDEATLLGSGSGRRVYRRYVEENIAIVRGIVPVSSAAPEADAGSVARGETIMLQQGILDQTLCMPQSRFLNWEEADDMEAGGDRKQRLRDIAFRLTYLAIYKFQHRPAAAEVQARLECVAGAASTCLHTLREAGVGPYDYECREAKYMVSWVGPWGLGANLRNGITYSLFQALLTGRILLLMNSVPDSIVNPASKYMRYLKANWPLASCERGDLQCVFLPVTPCVLTHADLEGARELNWTQQEHLRWNRAMPPGYDNDRVLIVGNDVNGRDGGWRKETRNSRELREVVVDLVKDVYRERQESAGLGGETAAPWDLSESLLSDVLDTIRTDEYIIDEAALFYFTRLNHRHRQKLQALTAEVLPENYLPETAIGIAVRSSDKCLRESECLGFDQYMDVAQGVAKKANERNAHAHAPQVDKIILTSESMTILNSRFDYPRSESFPYQFIVNPQDSAQGTGEPNEYKIMEHLNITADDIMFSTIAALRLQLLGGATVGNCCSSFHNMIRVFLDRGCGAVKQSHFECLQDNENPEYRICCFNKRGGKCGEKFKQGYNATFVEGSDVLRPDIDPSNLGQKAKFVYDRRQNRVKKYEDSLHNLKSGNRPKPDENDLAPERIQELFSAKNTEVMREEDNMWAINGPIF